MLCRNSKKFGGKGMNGILQKLFGRRVDNLWRVNLAAGERETDCGGERSEGSSQTIQQNESHFQFKTQFELMVISLSIPWNFFQWVKLKLMVIPVSTGNDQADDRVILSDAPVPVPFGNQWGFDLIVNWWAWGYSGSTMTNQSNSVPSVQVYRYRCWPACR
jgi:hypothetical protein